MLKINQYFFGKGDDEFMAFRRLSRSKGFSLVELLLVIVLMAIIMALVTVSGSSMMQSTSAQAEARRLMRTVQSLRSAWLAAYADTQMMPGVTSDLTPSELLKKISIYSDRSLSEEVDRYGNIVVETDTPAAGAIAIGFAGPWNLTGRVNNDAISTMKDMINNQKKDYGVDFTIGTSDRILIRIR
jgi:prepilin-type N-terminal cleavage/methylation domain-containing protein